MKILYCALAIDIAGVHGGATHVREVTNGLAALGHDVRLIARSGSATLSGERLHARAPSPLFSK